MKFFLLINVKMPTIVGILTFMSGKNSILRLSEIKKSQLSGYFQSMFIIMQFERLKRNKEHFLMFIMPTFIVSIKILHKASAFRKGTKKSKNWDTCNNYCY